LVVNGQDPRAELTRLLEEQSKARQDEVFGGMSAKEKAEYARKEKRINELEIELATKAAKRSSKANRRRT
jgi:hypothetical protein